MTSKIPDGWGECTMESVVDVIDPHPSHRAPPEVRDGIPFPGIGDFFSDGTIDHSSCRQVAATVYEAHKTRYQIEAGDLGFGRVASIGKVVRLSRDALPFAVSPTLAVLKPRFIDAGYLQHYLQGSQLSEQIAKLLTGTTRSSLGLQVLRKLRVISPPKPEQTKIAEILSTVDRAIEQTEVLIAKQQRIKTGLMQDLLTCGIDAHGNLRSEKTHEFKNSHLGRIPVEWKVTNFGQIFSRHGGYIQTGPFGSQLHSHEYVNEGIPVVMPQDISGNMISTSKIARITENRANSLIRHRMAAGDLVFARRGDLSRCAVIHENEIGWLCGTGCLLMRPPIRALSPRWTAETYRFRKTQLQVDICAVGSTMPNLNTGILLALELALPDINEQKQIEQRLSAAEKDEALILVNFLKLRIIKKALMQDLLTGRKRVTSLLVPGVF